MKSERALVTQMLNVLEYHQSQTRPIHNTELAIEAAREYLATEPKPTLTEALAQQGIKLRTEFEPKQRDSELAAEPRGERAELIARLNECLSGPAALTTREATAIKDAADMLEADAQPKQVTCQIYGHVVGACVECNTHIEAQQVKPYGWVVKGVPTVMRGSLAKEIQEQEAKRIGGECHAFPVYTTPQQAKRVPMDEPEDLYALALKADNWGQP